MLTVVNGVVCRSVPNVESYNIIVSRNALYIQGVTGGMCETSGERSLC